MRTEASTKESKGSWPEKVVRKWLDLRASNSNNGPGDEIPVEQDGRRRKRCSDKDDAVFMGGDLSAGDDGRSEPDGDDPKQNRPGHISSPIATTTTANSSTTGTETLRMFVGTWNVGGRAPHAGLNLRDWLSTPAPADIYVLGFQEVVPLNAGNVLGTKDKGPAARWLSLIRQALSFTNKSSTAAGNYTDAATTMHPDHQFQRPRVSFSDLISIEDMLEEDDAYLYDDGDDAYETASTNPSSSDEESEAGAVVDPERRRRRRGDGGYCLAASKQMVGIFLCVWVRADLLPHVTRVKASCVARGIMGYMGNKGSISISMTLRQTSFCFVCTHLASGEKGKDEVRRNSDVVEILKRTRFPRPRRRAAVASARTILQHSKIIWLGDLNYRLASSCGDTNELLQKSDWGALLEKDQLKLEQRAGKIFSGWEEGRICFPPTYKYLTNSDHYAVQTFETREKRRTPAWCDRILWKGEGMKQICYVRGECRFSDHRPVCSIFSLRVLNGVEADKDDRAASVTSSGSGNKKKGYRIRWPIRITNNSPTTSATTNPSLKMNSNSSNASANSSARVLAEEMLPVTRKQSCLDTSRF